MNQTFRWPLCAASIAIAGLLAGCATVNPRPDYQRAAEHVARATGNERLFEPGDDEFVANRVGELLANGLTATESGQIALLNNPQLQAAFYEIGMARADVVQSGLFSNPSLGMALRLPAGGGLANFEADLAQNIAELWLFRCRRRRPPPSDREREPGRGRDGSGTHAAST